MELDDGEVSTTTETVRNDSSSVNSSDQQLSVDDDADRMHIYDGTTSEAASDLMSLNSSIYEFVEENGRTYHKYKEGEGKYELPNDETEQNRLDLQHHLFSLTLNGRLHLAPIGDDVSKVLDICTGTGIWAIDFALKYPNAKVIGSDLSPIQPDYVPENCQFEIDDAEDEWTYSTKFDYIHARQTFTCFRSCPAVITQAFKSLKPGGWYEMQDMGVLKSNDGSTDGTYVDSWTKYLLQAGTRVGKDWDCARKYTRYFEEAGFVDVHEKVYCWPINTWPKGARNKELGRWAYANCIESLEAVSLRVMKHGLGWSPEQVDEFLKNVRLDYRNRRIHGYYPIYFVYGRKPE